MALESIQWEWASSPVDLGYTKLFCVPAVTSVSFRLVTVFLGTLWSSIKQINTPYVFDWEHGIALHAVQGNRASSPGNVEVSWFFSSCGRDDTSKLVLIQQHQGSCLGTRDTSDISARLGRAIQTLLKERGENQDTFVFATVILGFLSIFNKIQASSPFEALKST